ncbi:hypothetical protein CHELA20_50826 [Hyphomicrobiales bacterium]|nr:hypothetical protein CHELA20_50826 [Hyphomicrobiales bacterium]
MNAQPAGHFRLLERSTISCRIAQSTSASSTPQKMRHRHRSIRRIKATPIAAATTARDTRMASLRRVHSLSAPRRAEKALHFEEPEVERTYEAASSRTQWGSDKEPTYPRPASAPDKGGTDLSNESPGLLTI